MMIVREASEEFLEKGSRCENVFEFSFHSWVATTRIHCHLAGISDKRKVSLIAGRLIAFINEWHT